jgi:hypothetical protein
VPDPDGQSYDARRARVRRAYARRGRVAGNFYMLPCPRCGQLVPSKHRDWLPKHRRLRQSVGSSRGAEHVPDDARYCPAAYVVMGALDDEL